MLVEALSTNLLSVTRCDFCALLLPDAESGDLRVTILYNPGARGSISRGIVGADAMVRSAGKALRTGKSAPDR